MLTKAHTSWGLGGKGRPSWPLNDGLKDSGWSGGNRPLLAKGRRGPRQGNHQARASASIGGARLAELQMRLLAFAAPGETNALPVFGRNVSPVFVLWMVAKSS